MVPDLSPTMQVVLGSNQMSDYSILWKKGKLLLDTLALPAYTGIASCMIILVHLTFASSLHKRLRNYIFSTNPPSVDSGERPTSGIEPSASTEPSAEIQANIAEHGGISIHTYKVVRFCGCLALLAISIYSTEASNYGSQGIDIFGKWGKNHKTRKPGSPKFSTRDWLEVAMCMTYLYTSALALISVSTKRRWSNVAAKHLNVLLLVTFAVYFYRDIFPLMTYNRVPMDISQGWTLWVKIALLTLISVVIPLLIPRQYIPVDPKSPMTNPNPEQTASLLSLMLYSFLDPLVFLAYRIPKLSHEQLPPLADYDHAKHLTEKSFRHLDVYTGEKKRHLFWGLMRVFRREYFILGVMICVNVTSSFASPIGIKELLSYLETQGKDATIRPWVWILWLFIGPTVGSLAWQWYIYIATRTLVRAECLITQLIFEHSLRIRVKAEVDLNALPASVTTTPTLTPDQTSINEPSSPHDGNSVSSHVADASTTDINTLHSRDETINTSSSSVQSFRSGKGKSKSRSTKENDDKAPKKIDKDEHSSADNLVGKINNLVTTDLGNIVDSRDFLLVLVYIPLQIIFCITFLYLVLGWSAFVGLASILLLSPLPGYVAKRVQDVQFIRLKKTDARVQSVTETMNVLRMIKLFGWEKKMNQKVAEKRDEELIWIWRRQVLDLINGNLNFLIPVATMTIIMKQELSASKVFSSMAVFDMLRDQLHLVFYSITQLVTGKVSLDRVNDFLHNTELLDAFAKKETVSLFVDDGHYQDDKIGLRDATFAWSSDMDGSLTPSKRQFLLKIEGDLLFKQGQINLIIGPTGSGKTSLLMALLGEMHFIPSGPTSWFSLPRNGGVAYAAQESWVQNETIKDNILFGSTFDEVRYKKVIEQCCLERDLALFEAGDQTEVGEKGLTLSGGQKARITLARAIYSRAEIILLDDVLAALDVHTAKWIIDKCFSGDLIQGRTVLLVTHNVAMAQPIAGFVVAMGLDGRVTSQGSIFEALSKDKNLVREVTKEEEVLHKVDDEIDTLAPNNEPKTDGKLIMAEEMEEGHVSWGALKLYFLGLGGNYPLLFFSSFAIGLLLTELSNAAQTWYLGYWASQYDNHDSSDVPVFYYLGVYGSLLLFAVIIYCFSYVVYIFGAIRASRTIHKQLLESVLGTTLRWLDVTPTSRVIARCTQDIRAVDGPISTGLWWLSEMTMSMLIKFSAVVFLTPAFLGPGILVAILGGWCGQIYIAAQLSVKREMSNAKAPVLGHFGAAIAGLTSIRAYGSQKSFKDESLNRINRYTRAARTFYNLNRWICIRIDAMGGLFAAALAAYLVYFRGQTASNTGFSLNMAVGFSGMILWWVRVLNDFEVQGNSLERIQGYVNIEQEPRSTEEGRPPAYWPASGDIRVENLSARYSSDGPKVLRDISFHIKSGERIGVVGRTGSGKSSLTLSLLRCIFTEGNVYFDGIETKNINLDALRSNITIIPQIPELLSGSLRQNLDPFNQYDDAALNDALRAAGLFSLQSEMDEGRITLDHPISSGGGNLSVGQRQILALARAIVRGSKLLILDEATSAIDYKTDSIIQSSLRHELRGDVTLITVAHRLQTIMDADKIMVLDAGQVVEFDSPAALLSIPNGRLRALVDESADTNLLYSMAGSSK
ncbi:P-loop containing nucleoside triphosphate hydrolase protein [Collybia nuda]|uniref:P-loop containing nucleoside triphosphate hydrolase protein n=1 Tax=Collybia nuda TaxID=64659 RepID=A0A9P5XY52_9AGAR|nr:P-loop containing nucleoside triphosphate hydrolase protein [Collybia nuda]